MANPAYVVATIRPWNIRQFHISISNNPGEWHLITSPTGLTSERLKAIRPRYIFFPHWSERVPAEIIEQFECVCFHETDLPFGRGGSPIQNLIERGYDQTVVTAFRMTNKMDAGPVYSKRDLSLLGLAEEVYIRAAETVDAMISRIVESEPNPQPQRGNAVSFKRRRAEQSEIASDIDSLEALFDHIRMLDAAEYPRAYLDFGAFRLEFRRPALRTGRIEVDVTITLAAQ